jgi:hypothetical protein
VRLLPIAGCAAGAHAVVATYAACPAYPPAGTFPVTINPRPSVISVWSPACPAASSGATSNTSTLAFNTGSDVATHWVIIAHASGAGTLGKIVSGRLPTPITGAYTFAAGEFTIEATGA